jgi:hypothetical protein
MPLSSAGFSISGVNTATTVLLNLKASATVPINVVEFGIFYSVLSTTAYDIALVRMNAVGTGTITSTAGATHLSGGTSTAVLETAWATTRPSVTGSQFRRMVLPLTIGAGVIWPLGSGIMVPVSGGLTLQGVGASGATTGTLNGYITWDE